jgi:cation diffusion facilitator CzcD-associated flavoprotein CzcO
VNIQVLPSENGVCNGTPQSRCRISLASGGGIEALAVVFTGSGAETNLPEWASLEEVNSGPLMHARDVDLNGKGHELSGKVVVVVGGGMAAAQLALGAARAGAARVRLVCRRPLLPRPFDYDPKSTGGMFRHQLERSECPGERLKATRVAKGRGSITPPVLKELREEVIKQGQCPQ